MHGLSESALVMVEKCYHVRGHTQFSFSHELEGRGLKKHSALMDVIEPVDEVEEGEGRREYNPRTSVDGVHVGEVRDFDFELRGSSSQTGFLQMCAPVQAGAARPARLPVLDGRVVEHHGGGVVGLAHSGRYLISCHLVVDLQGRQQNVSLGVDLGATNSSGVKGGPGGRLLRPITAASNTGFSVPKLNHKSAQGWTGWMDLILMP